MRIALLLFALTSTAAADCVTQQFVGCGARVSATLDPGCENRYSFSGVKDQVISATIRPVDAPLTNPRLVLSAPFGVHAPIISGGEAATLNYVLPSNDVYTISVSADSPARYFFALGCRAANPAIPRDCVREELISGERVQWELTAAGCRFTDDSRLATAFVLYAVAGDPVTITLQSPDFKPRIAIYSFDVLVPQTTVDASTVTFVSHASARYWVMATTTSEETTGRYELTMSAQKSGCIPPLVMREPDDVTVTYGGRAKLSAGISASRDGLLWEWLDVFALPTIVSNEPELVTPPVALPQFYSARITNPCGSTMSRMVTVSAARNRRRTTR